MTVHRGWWTTLAGTIALLVSLAVASPSRTAAGAPSPAATAPTVTINQSALQQDPTKKSPITFTVRFSEPVTGFTAGDISLAGSTAPGDLTVVLAATGSASYTVWVGGMTGPGKIIASIPAGVARDSENNSNLASTSTDNSVTYKPAGPTVTINQGAAQPDPTSAAPIVFDVVFSSAVTGFDASDINFTGSTIGGTLVAQVSGSGASYTVSVTGMAGKGNLVASIPAGAARDSSNANSFASTSTDNAVAFDNVPPSVTINQAATQADPALASPILFTVVFSEPVSGFTSGDVSFAGSTAGGTLIAAVSGAGQVYTVSVTGMTTSGTVVASIPAGAALDSVANLSTASTSTDRTVAYSSAPSATITQAAAQADPTSTAPIAFAVAFSLPVTGFDGSDISFAGSTVSGTLAASVTGSGANYTVSVTGMSGSGTVVASVPAGAAFDAANKPNVASTGGDNSVTFDAVAPTVTINKSATQSDPTGNSPILFSVVFSEPVTGLTAGDVSFVGSTAGGALLANVAGSAANYTVSVTGMTSSGNVVVTVPTAAAQDQAGNSSQAPAIVDNTVAFDNVAPTVTVEQATAQADPTGASPIVFAVTFSEPVTGFSASDISFTGTTAGGSLIASVSGSGANYNISVTGTTTAGAVIASIPLGAAQDTAGNSSLASTSVDNVVTFDNVAPSVVINQAATQLDPTSGTPVLFTVAFSEPVTGFSAGDVSLLDSTVGGALLASVTGSGANYTVSVSGMSGTGAVIARVSAGAAADAAGNASAASTSVDNAVTYLPTGPTVTINQGGLQPDPTGTAPITFNVAFSAPVSGFDGSDISFAGSTVGGSLTAGVSGTGASYTVTVTGMTGTGVVAASIPAGVAMDGANNPNQASTSIDNHVTFDNVAPTVTINQSNSQPDPTSAAPIAFTVTFSEPVTGFSAADVSLAGSTAGGSLSALVSGSGANYTVSVSGMTTTGVVLASLATGAASDAVGNPSSTSTSGDSSVTFDNSGPTVTINQAAAQTDPANTSPIQFAVLFSEPVVGFTAGDVSFAGSTVGGTLAASVSGTGASYTISVTGMAGSGTVFVSIPVGAATDLAGNSSAASTSSDNIVTYSPLGPTVTINQMAGAIGRSGQPDPTSASPITFSVVFSAPVTGFTGSDINFTGSTVGGSLGASVSGSGASYSVSITGMSGNGTVVASIPADAAIDSAGVGNRASTSTDNSVTFDTTAPTVTINQGATQIDPTSTSPIQFSVTFSEPVVGFNAADVSLAGSSVGGTLVASVTGSGANYTVSVTGMSGTGTVVANIPAAAAKDAAGNNSQGSTSTDNTVTFGTTGPSVTINQAAGQPDPTNGSPIQFAVVFSSPVTGFTGGDINFTGSTVGGTLVANVTGVGNTYAVSVTGMSGTGTVVATIPAGAAQDAAGNLSTASTSTDNTVTSDNVVPTVTINQAVGQADPTNASPIQFTVVFSEPVTGFTAADVVLVGSTVGGTLAANVSGTGANYTVSVAGMAGNGTVVVSIPGGAAQDGATNINSPSTSTDNSVTYTATGPTVTIDQAAGQADPTNGSPIVFTVVFSAPVTGFTAADVSFAGSTVGGLAANVLGSGSTYTITVTAATGPGTVVATIPVGAATDALGNPSQASTSTDNTVTFDNVAPTVTINQASGQADPTNASPIVFTVTFSEPVSGFAPTDVSFAGSTIGGDLLANVSGSGASYTVSVAGMTGTGAVVATIAANAATDVAGNNNVASTSTDNSVTFSSTGPTVTINQSVGQPDPTNASPLQFAVVFSAPVTGFTGTDINLAGSTVGGTLVANVTGSGATYTVSVSGMTGTGTVVATIPAGAAVDGLGNPSGASSSVDNSVTFDNVAPTVTINQAVGQPDPTNTSPIVFTVTFSEPVSGFAPTDVSFASSTVGGTLVANVGGSGASYTVSVTGMTSAGTVVAAIVASAATDLAGNNSAASTSSDNTVTYNATGPSVTITQDLDQRDPTNTSPIVFTVVFSAPVTGFTAADVNFAGSTLAGLVANVTGTGANYSVAVTGMNGTGTVVATIPAGAATDALGNPSQASINTDNTVTFDNVAPTVTINQAATQNDPTNLSTIQFTVIFSEIVTGFTGADVSFTGSTIGGTLAASVTGTGTTYTVTVTGMTGNGTVVASIPGGAAQDAAGNLNTASTSTDNTVTHTVIGPTVTINQAAGQPDPTNASPIQFTVVFSAPVTGFAADDINFSSGTLTGLSATVVGSGANYSVTVTGMNGTGTVRPSILAGAAIDAAGNPTVSSSSADNVVTFDNVAPTVTINQAAGQADPTNVSPVVFTVVFSEPVNGFTTGDVVLTGSTVSGTLIANVSGTGPTYTVSVTGMTGTGTVVVSIPASAATDPAGNSNAASTSTDNAVIFNNVAPSVTINQAAGQIDPINTSPIVFTAVFSAPVTGFTGADVALTDSTAPGTLVATVTGSGTTYGVSISGMTAPGNIVVSIPAGAAIDAANNPSQASTSVDNTVTFDNIVPTVTINQASGQADPTNASPILFSVVFSEPVVGFAGTDVSFAGSTVGGTLAATISGSGANYTVSVTGMTGSGNVVASIPAGAATDPATNPNQASTSTDNSVTYNATAPTVTINQAATQVDPTNTSPIVFSVLFSVPVTGLTGSDISFTGSTAPGTLVASVAGSGGAYAVSVTGMTASGTVQVSIPAGAAQDAASNLSQASTSTDNIVSYDTSAPTVTINQAAGQADPTNASPIVFTVAFSESVTGFTASDVSLSASTVGGTLVASVSGSGANYTVSITGMSGAGTVVASIPGGAATDPAGNNSATATSTDNSVTFNAIGPTVTINQGASQADLTNTLPIIFSVVFSAPVTGFTGSDVNFTGSTVGGAFVADVTGAGALYTVSVSGLTGSGTVTANIPAGAAADALGNPSAASTSTDNTVTFDNVMPTVTINQAAGQSDPTNASPIVFSVVFSEPVTGFIASDVSLSGSTVGGTLVATLTGSGANYTLSVTGMTGIGTVVASIPAGGATDLATNPNAASTSTDNTVTYNATAPSVTINQAAGQVDPTGAAPIAFTVVFSVPVTGFTPSDVSFTGSTAPGVAANVTGSGTTYTVSVTGMTTSGLVVVNIPAGAASDQAGNLNQASTSADNSVTYDVTGPRVISSSPSGTVGGPIDRFTLIFNEAIQASTFTLADVVSLTGPGGAIAPIAVNALNSQASEVLFASQTSGSFTLVIGPDILDLVSNPMDQNANGLNGEVTADRFTTSFTIAGPAVLTSVTPQSGQQGRDNLNVVVNAQSSHFVDGVTTAGFSGNGIAVNSVTVTSPTSATLNINISPIATADLRSITLTTNTEVVSSAAAGTFFLITPSPATIASVVPNQGKQGEVLQVTVNGFSTHFATGSTSVSFGAGIVVNSWLINSPTSLTANITILLSADIGPRTVVVTTGGELAGGINAFTVNPGDPVITSVSPATARQGETLAVTVTGQLTHFDANTQPDFGPGILIDSIVPTSATTATVTIAIDHDAAPGSRTVFLRTNQEEAKKVGGFTVLPGLPTLVSITPVAAVQGTGGTLIVNGDFTHFTQDQTTVSLGPGITMGLVTVNGPALLSVPFSVSDAATIGPRDVIVGTGSEVVGLANGFTVLPGEAEVTVIDPNAGQRGITLNVSITGHFTNWQNGVTHVAYGAGVTVNSNVVSGPTQITTNITIDAGATLGPRDVVVTTNTQVLTVFSGFTVNDVDITAPTILTVSPAAGTVDVPLNVVPTIEMNEPLDRTSATAASSVLLYDGFLGQFVPSTVTLDVTGRLITVVPSQLLAVNRAYALYIGWYAAIKDVAGNQFGGTVYGFTTGFATDTTGPTLVVINPPDGETGVPVNTALALKFDRPINAAARAAGLQILKAGAPVAGTFTFADELRRINFVPAVPWDSNTTYTIALSSGLIDLAGNSLTNPGMRTFTTGTATDTSAPTVTGFSPQYGDTNVGLHPTIRVTFSEPINPMTLVPQSTFFLYNVNLNVFVPTTMTIAPNRQSATLTPVGNLNPFTQYYFYVVSFYDVAGNPAGGSVIYFTTGDASDATPPTVQVATPAAGTTNVPVNALVQVRMSEPIDPTSIDNTTLQLTPAAAGTVTLLADRRTIKLTLSGTLAPSTAYTLNVSGARDTTGNQMSPFSAPFTTADSSTPDTTAPTVVSFNPANGATNVALTPPITITVSEPIDPSRVGPNSMGVYVNNGTIRADGSYVVSSDGMVVTFTPAMPFPTNSLVYVYSNLDSSITDFANNVLQYTYSTFTTASAPADTTAPIVVAVTPNDGTSEVGSLATITLTFSESMNTLNSHLRIGLFAGGVPQSAGIGWSADNRMAVLSGNWPLNTVMTVVATADNTDLAGNHLAPFSSTFRTASTFDPNRPYVVTQLPTGSGVDRTTPITLYVNKPLNTTTVSSAFYVSQNGVLVDGTVRTPGNGTAINFTPSAPFAPNAVIQVFVTSTAQDTFGNAMTPFSGSFTIAPDPTVGAPVIVRTSPSIGSVNNPLNAIIEVEFSEQLNPATVTMPANFGVYLFGSGTAIPGALSLRNGDRTIRFVPSSPLQAGAYYYVFLQAGIQDTQGTPLGATNFYFYLGTETDITTPTVTSVVPVNGSPNVGINASIRVAFSEPISPLSLTPGSVTLSTSAGPLPVTLVLGNNDTSVRIVPQNPLPANTLITVLIDPYDVAGHEVPVLQSQFTTGGAADTVPASVVSASWTPNQTGVPTNSVLQVVFSEPMDVPSVLAQLPFFLYDWRFGGYVTGTLTANADARTFTFAPAPALAVNRSYSAQLSSALDIAGNMMTSFQSFFTTALVSDGTAPTVIGVNPLNGAVSVPRNAKIRVLFDEPIAADSVTEVKLLRNGSPVPVSSVLINGNRNVTLTATGLLVPNTVYTVSAQVRDTSGNNQPVPFVSTFTTGNDVDLIAPTLVSTSPFYGQTGVPLNSVFRVLLSEPIDPITIDSNNFYIYNTAGQPPVPATITISGDRRSVLLTPTQPLLPFSQYLGNLFNYTDSVGNFGQGVGIYFITGDAVDGTAPTVTTIAPPDTATNVAVNARVRVVMSEAIDQTSVANNSIQLTPSIAGTVALGSDQTTLTFTPALPLSPSTSYMVSVSGLRDLAAHTMVPFSSSFTTSASSTADSTGPTVVSMSPVNGAAGVAVNSSIVMVTSEPITRAVVGPATMPVFAQLPTAGYVQVAGTYSVDSTNMIVTFTPASRFPANTTVLWYTNYTQTITDYAGNLLEYQTPQFTTGSEADVAVPTLLSVTPADGASGLGPYTTITLTFSESVSPATIDGNTLGLFNGAARVGVSITRSLDNRMIFLTTTLSPDTNYTIVGTSGIQDLSGNAFAGFTSSFSTAPFDALRPSVITQRPVGSGVRPTTSITLYLDSALDPATVPAATFVAQNGALVPGTVTVSGNGRVVLFTPSAPFAPSSIVEIFMTESATDPSRNPVFPYFGQFLVAPDPATLAPTLVQTNPIAGTVDNPQNSVVDVEFSEPLNPATVTDGSFGVYLFGTGSAIAGTRKLLNGNRTIHFAPTDPLQAGAYYYVFTTADITDTQGTAAAATNVYFYVGSTSDDSALAAPTIAPSHGASGVGLNALGIIRFNEPINPTTINSTTVTLTAGTAVPFVLSHIDNKTFYVTPQAPLPASTAVTLSVDGAEDIAGHKAPITSATFTTGPIPDTIRPSIVATNPVYGSTNVPVNAVLQMMFDEPMDPGGIPADLGCALYDYNAGACVAGGTASLSADGRVWTYVPPANLQPAHQYAFGPSGNLLDLAGNPLNAVGIVFITSSETDTIAPQVLAVSPPALSGVPRNAVVEMVFSEPVRATTIGQVSVIAGGNPLPIAARTLSNGNRTLTLTLTGLMAANTVHTISIAGISDIAGNVMATTTSLFTTGNAVDLVSPSPTVVFTPIDGSSGVPVTVTPSVQFSEPMNPVRAMSLSTGTGLYLYIPATGQFVSCTVSFEDNYRKAILTPTAPLQPGTQYQFGVYYSNTDLAGNQFPTSVWIYFTTQ